MARLDWKGKEISAKASRAARVGVDATMAAAVHHAKANHPAYPPASRPGHRFANRTGFLDASIVIKDPASTAGWRTHGEWGATANYALYVEIGTSRDGSGAPRAETRADAGPESGMWSISYPSPADDPRMAPRYFLRPAASAEYGRLAVRVGAAFRGEQMV
jgi:hypothetical protein